MERYISNEYNVRLKYNTPRFAVTLICFDAVFYSGYFLFRVDGEMIIRLLFGGAG